MLPATNFFRGWPYTPLQTEYQKPHPPTFPTNTAPPNMVHRTVAEYDEGCGAACSAVSAVQTYVCQARGKGQRTSDMRSCRAMAWNWREMPMTNIPAGNRMCVW